MEDVNSIPGFIDLFNRVHPELAIHSVQPPSVVDGATPGQIKWLPILIGGIALAAIIYIAYEKRREKEKRFLN